MFDVRILARLADIGDGFGPRSESPFAGAAGGAGANARACSDFACDSNFAVWQTRQAWLPTYCGVAIEAIAPSAKIACPSLLKMALVIAGLQYSAVFRPPAVQTL